MTEAIVALLGALLYRIRGGWLPTGRTQLARMIWCVPTGALVWWLLPGGPWWAGPAVALAAFAGLLIAHGRRFDLGRANGRRGEDAAHMACIGIARLLLILSPVALVGGPAALWWAYGGVLHAVAYWIGWCLPTRRDWARRWWVPAAEPIAYGEVLWGGVQWLMIAAACS